MTGIFHATLTVWGLKEGQTDLVFNMEAPNFNDALKRAFELKNVVRAKTVPGRQRQTFRMWPHPHDVVKGWEDGEDHVAIVSEVIAGNDAPDEAPERLQHFQSNTLIGEKGWWHPPMPVLRPGFQERPRARFPHVAAPAATTTSTEAAVPVVSTTFKRSESPGTVQTEPPPKRQKGRGTFNVV